MFGMAEFVVGAIIGVAVLIGFISYKRYEKKAIDSITEKDSTSCLTPDTVVLIFNRQLHTGTVEEYREDGSANICFLYETDKAECLSYITRNIPADRWVKPGDIVSVATNKYGKVRFSPEESDESLNGVHGNLIPAYQHLLRFNAYTISRV